MLALVYIFISIGLYETLAVYGLVRGLRHVHAADSKYRLTVAMPFQFKNPCWNRYFIFTTRASNKTLSEKD